MNNKLFQKTFYILISLSVILVLLFTGCKTGDINNDIEEKISTSVSDTKETSLQTEKEQKVEATSIQEHQDDHVREEIVIELRKFPYPFKAMVAIASDIDGCTVEEFEIIHRFLNTYEDTGTRMGQGVGLDIADSFFMYKVEPNDDMYYWEGLDEPEPKDKDKIIKYINAGWIDFLHSYGCFSVKGGFVRELAEKAIKELKEYDIYIDVYVDHGDVHNRQNWCKDVDYMRGAAKGEPEYHADITIDYGIKFTWSANTQKGVDNVIFPWTARDGQKVWGFHRYTNNWQANLLHMQMAPWFLNELKRNSQYIIFSNHFGAVFDGTFIPEVVSAFRYLKQEQDSGEILVARTSRLLRYNLAQLYTKWEFDSDNNRIIIHCIEDPLFGDFIPSIDDVRGLTFVCENVFNSNTTVYIKDQMLTDISFPSEDVLMINWFEPDTNDYTKK